MTHSRTRASSRLRRALLAATLLAGATACSRIDPQEGIVAPRAEIVFVNQSQAQADVFAVGRAGQSVRLGTVFPGNTERLSVTSTALSWSPVTIVARLLAISSTPSTGPVSLLADDRVQVTLSQDMRTLTVLPARP